MMIVTQRKTTATAIIASAITAATAIAAHAASRQLKQIAQWQHLTISQAQTRVRAGTVTS